MKFLLKILVVATVFGCASQKDAASGPAPEALNGSWELNYIGNTKLHAAQLYQDRKPFLNFNIKESKLSGNTGCNSFTGMISSMSAGEIRFDTEHMAMTKMFCEGGGETAFLDNFKAVKRFKISEDGKTLSLTDGSTDLMRLAKKD